jgi:hypothetical protein
MRTITTGAGALLACLLWAAPVGAQIMSGTELGVDFGFNVSFIDDSEQEVVSVGLPASDFSSLLQNVRVGFPVSSRGRLEPAFGFSALDDGYTTYWRVGLGVDYLFMLCPEPCRAMPFIRVGNVLNVMGSSKQYKTQMGIAGGSGFGLMLGDAWGIRVEGGVVRMFPNGDAAGRWDMTGNLGLSLYLN